MREVPVFFSIFPCEAWILFVIAALLKISRIRFGLFGFLDVTNYVACLAPPRVSLCSFKESVPVKTIQMSLVGFWSKQPSEFCLCVAVFFSSGPKI